MCVRLRHDETARGCRTQGRGQRGDREPRAQRQAGRLRSRRARPSSRRSTSWATNGRPSCAANGRGSSASCSRSSRTRSSRPSPRSSAARSPSRASRRSSARRRSVASPEADYVDLLLQQQVSGVVFAGGLYAQADAPHGHYARLAERGLPTVLVNASIEGLGFPAGLVRRRGRRRAGDGPPHLARSHTDRDAPRTHRSHPVTTQARAWQGGGGAGRFPARARRRRPRPLFARSCPGCGRPLAQPGGVTGIVCASDPMALGAIRAARRAGLNVPGDVSVVGFDDSSLMNCTEPPLTTVRQPIDADGPHGHRAAGRADRWHAGPARRAPLRAGAGRPRLDRARIRGSLTRSVARWSGGLDPPAVGM